MHFSFGWLLGELWNKKTIIESRKLICVLTDSSTMSSLPPLLQKLDDNFIKQILVTFRTADSFLGKNFAKITWISLTTNGKGNGRQKFRTSVARTRQHKAVIFYWLKCWQDFCIMSAAVRTPVTFMKPLDQTVSKGFSQDWHSRR